MKSMMCVNARYGISGPFILSFLGHKFTSVADIVAWFRSNSSLCSKKRRSSHTANFEDFVRRVGAAFNCRLAYLYEYAWYPWCKKIPVYCLLCFLLWLSWSILRDKVLNIAVAMYTLLGTPPVDNFLKYDLYLRTLRTYYWLLCYN